MALSAPTILGRTLPLTICFLLETWSPGAGLEARRPTGQIGEPQAKRTTSPPSKTHGRWFLNPITKSRRSRAGAGPSCSGSSAIRVHPWHGYRPAARVHPSGAVCWWRGPDRVWLITVELLRHRNRAAQGARSPAERGG